jgi:thiol-disulfide isomerase/thioredoxin
MLLALVLLSAQAQKVGEPAPDFTLVNGAGELVQLSDFAGTPLILNTWATWCAFCIEELPLFEQILSEVNQASEAPALNIFLVNNNEGFTAASSFLADDVGVTLPSGYNPTREQRRSFQDQGIELEDSMDFVRKYRVRGMPSTFFIDTEGIIQGIKTGLLLPTEASSLLASIGIDWPAGGF